MNSCEQIAVVVLGRALDRFARLQRRRKGNPIGLKQQFLARFPDFWGNLATLLAQNAKCTESEGAQLPIPLYCKIYISVGYLVYVDSARH